MNRPLAKESRTSTVRLFYFALAKDTEMITPERLHASPALISSCRLCFCGSHCFLPACQASNKLSDTMPPLLFCLPTRPAPPCAAPWPRSPPPLRTPTRSRRRPPRRRPPRRLRPPSRSPRASLKKRSRSEERRVGKECRSRWSPYH